MERDAALLPILAATAAVLPDTDVHSKYIIILYCDLR